MVYVWLTKHVMIWGEINNVREWGRFKVHHKADRWISVSFFRYTDNIKYNKNSYAMNDVLMNEKWNGVWMTYKSGRVEFQSVSPERR